MANTSHHDLADAHGLRIDRHRDRRTLDSTTGQLHSKHSPSHIFIPH